MHILFTINSNYLWLTEICIKSIIRFPAENGYSFYILHSDLTAEEISSFEKRLSRNHVQFHFIQIDSASFSAFPQNSRYPQTMYYRLLAAKFLPEHLDRILYLDPDIIVIRPLDELYKMPFCDKLFFGATHVKKFLTKVNAARLDIPEDTPYLNSGVLLMNLAALRKQQNINSILEYIQRRQNFFTLPDQDILSALYGQETWILDTMIYNLSDRILTLYNANPQNEKRDLDWVQKNAVILHFCGKNKPWKENYHGILKCFFDEVANSDLCENEKNSYLYEKSIP